MAARNSATPRPSDGSGAGFAGMHINLAPATLLRLAPGKNKELSKTIEARMEGATAMAKGGPQPAKDTALEKQVAA